MRKWKKGVIALLVFFLGIALFTVTENYTVRTVLAFTVVFSVIYALGLVVFFIFQQIYGWSRKESKPRIEETAVKTRTITVYECGHCKNQYSNSQTCPLCGSPYRKIVEERTKEEEVEKWKPRPRSKTIR